MPFNLKTRHLVGRLLRDGGEHKTLMHFLLQLIFRQCKIVVVGSLFCSSDRIDHLLPKIPLYYRISPLSLTCNKDQTDEIGTMSNQESPSLTKNRNNNVSQPSVSIWNIVIITTIYFVIDKNAFRFQIIRFAQISNAFCSDLANTQENLIKAVRSLMAA